MSRPASPAQQQPRQQLYDDTTFTHRGYTFKVRFPHDEDHGAPWEECDGHGPVSDWTRRAKRPGERILIEDRESRRYYDVAEALQIARRDQWNTLSIPAPAGGETPRQQAARAVEADYEYLRRWCRDEWQYVGVVVCLCDDDGNADGGEGTEASVWGIESDADDYLTETAYELADEIMARIEVEQPAQLSEN